MAKRLLDYDPLTKTTTWHDYDHSSRKTYLITEQDCTLQIERNKALQNMPEYRSRGVKNEFMHFAHIPNNVITQIKQKHHLDIFIKDDLPKIEKLLQSNEYRYLRTVDRI